jgi:phosphohistidine phosphatase
VDDVRRLVVMRHARTATHAESDHVRPLTGGGRRDALAAGRFLASSGITPDHALVSDALRARQTWELVSEGCGLDGDLEVSDEVYRGSADSVLDLVRGLGDGLRRVVLVGHNPTVAHLVAELDEGDGDPRAAAVVAGGFPPGGIAVLEVTTPWSAVGPGTARLVQAFVPRT